MYVPNLDEIQLAIENHTILKLAGVQFPERLKALEDRSQQLTGMLELARRLNVQTKFIRFLERHRQVLLQEIDGP